MSAPDSSAKSMRTPLGRVRSLLEDVHRLEMHADGLEITDELRRDLEDVVRKHGGRLEHLGHQTTTLEELFLRIIAEAKAHPGRRHLPDGQRGDGGSKVEDGSGAAV